MLGFEQKVAKFDALDPHLKSYAGWRAPASIGCSWCLDFGYYLAHEDGLDEAQGARGAAVARVGGVHRPRARRDGVRRGGDRDPADRDRRAWWPRCASGSATPAVVELTMMVAIENQRSRFNAAMGLASQGYSDVCELPLAVPSGT